MFYFKFSYLWDKQKRLKKAIDKTSTSRVNSTHHLQVYYILFDMIFIQLQFFSVDKITKCNLKVWVTLNQCWFNCWASVVGSGPTLIQH